MVTDVAPRGPGGNQAALSGDPIEESVQPPGGLSEAEARERLGQAGPNEIPEEVPSAMPGVLKRLWVPQGR
jgi:hypothetical protein